MNYTKTISYYVISSVVFNSFCWTQNYLALKLEFCSKCSQFMLLKYKFKWLSKIPHIHFTYKSI